MNRELVQPSGAGIYPLTGDVTSTAGSATVRVTGLQGVSLQNAFPVAGAVIQYNVNNNEWEPILNAQIQVNSITVSDDPLVAVNQVKPIQVNGA